MEDAKQGCDKVRGMCRRCYVTIRRGEAEAGRPGSWGLWGEG